jgi:hypothetical protein
MQGEDVMSVITKLAPPDLSALGNVPAEYVHHDRWVEASALLEVPGGLLKWYNVGRPGVPISAEMEQEARDFLLRESEKGIWELGYGLGFVFLHDCAGVTFLSIGVWHNNNELWRIGYERDPHAPLDAYILQTFPNPTKPMLCVWELTPVWHERNAWSRYLFSARDGAAKQAYLDDTASGVA